MMEIQFFKAIISFLGIKDLRISDSKLKYLVIKQKSDEIKIYLQNEH